MNGRATAVAALCALAGCAGASRFGRSPDWRFPESYQATQVVTVTLPAERRQFIGSITRSGKRVDLVLFEAALQIPLIAASGGDGPPTETAFIEGLPQGLGQRLVDLIGSMHALGFRVDEDGSRSARHRGIGFFLHARDAAGECAFPQVIDIDASVAHTAITVETTDVACSKRAP